MSLTTNSPAYLASIHHDGSQRYVSNPYPAFGETVTIRLRTAVDAPIKQVLLRTIPDGEQHFVQLTPQHSPNDPCRWWQTTLLISMPVVNYRFVVLTDDNLWNYNGVGLHEYAPTDYHDFRLLADYQPPRWVHRSVFYQIFPDRFADGDPQNNVQDGEWSTRNHAVVARRWDEPPGQSNPSFEFYGGDLQGIMQRLDYLLDLGINALYLNPIFLAPSVHRYDVSSYEQVDPHLGGEAALAELRTVLSQHDMRVMLDIVPNHCGSEHPWFKAALSDTTSPSSDHFIFTDHPEQYASWLGVQSLPKLDYRSQTLRDYMYAGPNSVFRRWLQPPYSIDAWRVDVANMLGLHGQVRLNAEVSRDIREAVKQENSAAYLIGENFFDATSQLQGDQYDGNMNYRGFTVPLWEWLHERRLPAVLFGKETSLGLPVSTQGLAQSWAAFAAPIPWIIALQQFNLIDSHDTARIQSRVGGNVRLQQLAAVIQHTYPGVPCIFYGDEIGLLGDEANSARRTMPWDESQWDHGLRQFYQRLIALRRTSNALAYGGFQLLYTDSDTLAFLRDTDDEQIIVVGYRGSDERQGQLLQVHHGAIADGTRFVEVFSGIEAIVENGALPLPTMQQGPAVWRTILDNTQ